jgi:hypothetical protein
MKLENIVYKKEGCSITFTQTYSDRNIDRTYTTNFSPNATLEDARLAAIFLSEKGMNYEELFKSFRSFLLKKKLDTLLEN